MKKKTVLQIAIENCDQCLNSDHVKSMLIDLLEAEKAQTIKFANDYLNDERPLSAEQFYNLQD